MSIFAAELTTVSLDSKEILLKEFKLLLKNISKDYYDPQNFVPGKLFNMPFNQLTPYFLSLFEILKKELEIETSEFALLYHEYPKLISKTSYSGYIHKDVSRVCAVSIPIITLDPVVFYDYDPKLERKARKNPARKPAKVLHYKYDHPTIINTNEFHNVFTLDETAPRALVQLNCFESFKDIFERNKHKLNVL